MVTSMMSIFGFVSRQKKTNRVFVKQGGRPPLEPEPDRDRMCSFASEQKYFDSLESQLGYSKLQRGQSLISLVSSRAEGVEVEVILQIVTNCNHDSALSTKQSDGYEVQRCDRAKENSAANRSSRHGYH